MEIERTLAEHDIDSATRRYVAGKIGVEELECLVGAALRQRYADEPIGVAKWLVNPQRCL